jgi:hypothetical protein
MTALTATERGDLAERLLPLAARLACLVHGDGDHHDITHATRNLDRHELLALIVDLAALVDPNQRVSDALDFVTWNEHGKPAPPVPAGRLTIRQLASDHDGTPDMGYDMILDSERRNIARHLYLHDGLALATVARAVKARDVTVQRWRDEGGWQQAPTITEYDAGRKRKERVA